MKPLATAAACAALALLTFFQFPGHTWLQQDSQIYVPILEHLRDPDVLRNDILVQHPHVAFTLYDEVALGLRAVSGAGFREVLGAQQIVTRAFGIWGLMLMAEALGLAFLPSVLVAAICSLGALIPGPAVLTFEYEPTPRAFALPLLICALGLAARQRYLGAGIAAAAAFLYHPPTALPFWGVYLMLALWPGELRRARAIALVPQSAAGEAQRVFARLDSGQEFLQRMRAAYVWVSTWPTATMSHHLLILAILAAAFLRVRRSANTELRVLVLGLAALGVVSMPGSWLLLEEWHWGLVPQVQPMRALLFLTLGMLFLCAAAGARAMEGGRRAEALGFLACAFVLPLQPLLTGPYVWTRVGLALALAATTAMAGARLALIPAIAAFFVIPMVGGVVNYPSLHSADLAQLSQWARASTPRNAVFVFADVNKGLAPGIFRSEALRAVYVDWKGGGQVNYLKDLGEQWWFRWQLTRNFQASMLPQYAATGIRYVVLQKPLAGAAVFHNSGYFVYDLKR
jgi:hypothetical protein